MKAFRKDILESFVVKRALGYVLQDSVIEMLADALVENQKRENTHLPALREELKKVNKKIDNIAAAIRGRHYHPDNERTADLHWKISVMNCKSTF